MTFTNWDSMRYQENKYLQLTDHFNFLKIGGISQILFVKDYKLAAEGLCEKDRIT